MEDAVFARQEDRQGLLLHLGRDDIANLLSPLEDVLRDAAGADLAEGGGGGAESTEAEAVAQRERGEARA